MAVQSTLTWQTGEVVEASAAADGVRRLVIRPDRPVPAAPGTHVDVEVLDGDRVLRRSYSIVSSENAGQRWTLSVHLAPKSRGGSRAMHALAPGDRLRISDPLQNFPLGVGARRYILLAGGIGVTALVAMARTLRRRGDDYTFVYVGRSRSAMAWLDHLGQEHGDRLQVHVDDEGTSLDVGALVGQVVDDRLAADTELYMCGPIRLMDAVRRAWAKQALPAANLRLETFGNSGAWAPQEFSVSIPDTGCTITVPEDRSLLEALELAGVEVMWDCRKGECGLCVVRVRARQGRIDHRDVFLDEEQKATDERICLCVSRVAAETAGAGGAPVVVIERP
jgi:ferredoxin-NADP reductase